MQLMYRLHGTLEYIISDRGVQFTSQFLQEFLKMLKIAQGLSSYHPQTSGMWESANLVLD